MSHANAALTPRQRARVGRLIVEEGWTVAPAARHFRISWPTAAKWAQRYSLMGRAGMDDRSSRPVRTRRRTARRLESKIVHARINGACGADPVGTGAQARAWLDEFADSLDADEVITAHGAMEADARVESVRLTASS